MPKLTPLRVQGFCAIVAVAVFLGALGHDWAFDDVPIIASNPAAQSVPGALDAFFAPYWPGDETTSGQYRPFVILSYAFDWMISGGSPAWFHFVNVAMHAAATALFVCVALAWLPPAGALMGGLTFAVHPVHVEAVVNVVGRAEVLVALGVFVCVLASRRYRHTRDATARKLWLSVVLATLLASLLVKEHAVIVIAVVFLDALLDPIDAQQSSMPLYVGIVAVTAGWLYLWSDIAGHYVPLAEAATIRGLTPGQRLATMFPAQLEVVRLLAWPLDLAADYNPQVILRRTDWSFVASLGLITSAAIVTLAIAVWRRAPAITFGILFAVVSYAPTSNLLFSSGIILAERNLYLSVVAPAMVVGWLFSRLIDVEQRMARVTRVLAFGSMAALLLVYTVRTVIRVPFWRDSDNVLLMDFVQHPENYRARLRLGGYYRTAGNLPGALTEAITAGAIFSDDPWVAQYSVVRALDLGLPQVALAQAEKAYASDPRHPSFARFVVRARIAQAQFDSAAVVARRSIVDAPNSPLAMWSYTQVLDSLGGPAWQLHLARARFDFLEGRLAAATAQLDSGLAASPPTLTQPSECWEVSETVPIIGVLKADAVMRAGEALKNATARCRAFASDGTLGS